MSRERLGELPVDDMDCIVLMADVLGKDPFSRGLLAIGESGVTLDEPNPTLSFSPIHEPRRLLSAHKVPHCAHLSKRVELLQ